MTVDPFHDTRIATDSLRDTLDQVRDFSPDDFPTSSAMFAQVASTYEPMRTHKTLRILAMHLWVLTARKRTELKTPSSKTGGALTIAEQIQPELDAVEQRLAYVKALPEQTIPVKEEIKELTKRARSIRDRLRRANKTVAIPTATSGFVDSLRGSHCPNLDSLCQAMAVMDHATSKDMLPLSRKHDPISSPVRAEMVQNLSSTWDMTAEGASVLGENNMIMGASRLDPASEDSDAEHFVLMPLLVPFRKGQRMGEIEPIPLLWTTNIDHDPHGYVRLPGKTGSETIVQGTANYISVKPRELARGQTPQWKYVIAAVPVAKGPVIYDRSNPAVHSYNPGDRKSPFEFSAGLWRVNRLTASILGMRLPIENMDDVDGLLWSADLPLISRVLGWSAERAVAFHDILHKPNEVGTKTRPWSALKETPPELLASPHATTAKYLFTRYQHHAPELGKWGALVSGLRYLPLAWRSGYMSSIPGLTAAGAATLGILNHPDNELLASTKKRHANKKVAVAAHTRKSSSRHARSFRVKSTTRTYTAAPQCGRDIIGAPDFLHIDALTKRDISSARDMLAPLVAECLCKFITEIDAGVHGPAARAWMRTAMDKAEVEPEEFTQTLTRYMQSRAQAKGNAIVYAGSQIKGT